MYKRHPTDVAIASDISAGLIFGNLPFSSSIPAFVLTPMIVPNVSNKSTKRNANTTMMKFTIPTALKSRLKPVSYTHLLNSVIKENDEKAAYFANKTLRKVQKKVGLTERIR